MRRKLRTEMFSGRYGVFSDYRRFIRENPYIEIVSVISSDISILVTYYE